MNSECPCCKQKTISRVIKWKATPEKPIVCESCGKGVAISSGWWWLLTIFGIFISPVLGGLTFLKFGLIQTILILFFGGWFVIGLVCSVLPLECVRNR